MRQLAKVADLFKKHLGLSVLVIGIDSVEGLPPLSGAEDHREIWDQGQFAMDCRDGLINEFSTGNCLGLTGRVRIPGRAGNLGDWYRCVAYT